jgi:hypothetical protein
MVEASDNHVSAPLHDLQSHTSQEVDIIREEDEVIVNP